MENRNSFKKVLEHLIDAQQLLRIGIEKGNLSTIERDILLEKLRSCYEEILFDKKVEVPSPSEIQYLSSKPEKVQVDTPKEIEPQKREIEIPKVISSASKAVEIILEDAPTSAPVAKAEVENNYEVEKELEKKENTDRNVDIIETKRDSEKTHSEILGEKYQGKKKFRNEVLGNGKKDMSSVLQNKPIFDLTKAIGINDKFLLTKELFNGNAELYSKTIRQLNEFTDINDALIYIQDNFSWDDKNEAANQLIDLIRRKLLMG
ncbi:MAG: hypothetical protein CVT98_10950 [Bacteroidetes bacterium HGW-Bacteroidetes-15]|nr:MAG: hypothetical protein CVT98_10950 [Bacteroidetes bacterium HGW-Bacteroidetes-15]